MATELTARFSANSSGMTQGIEQLREKLNTLNTSLIETKQKVKSANDELKSLQKQQQELAAAMKDGGTKEQQAQMLELQTRAAQLTTNLGQLRTSEKELQTDISSANRQLTEQKNGLNALNSSLSRISTAVKAFAAAYGGKKLWEMLIGSNAEMEQYQTSMEVMLGDVEKAQQMIEDMRTFAAKTPLVLTDIVSNGTLLMNYGVEADKLIDTLTKLGDLSLGNTEKLNRISLAYGQMLAKGKVTGEELRQMAEAGVPLQTALAESIGVTGAEFSKMVSAGKVGIDDLNRAITELTSGNGKFSGMMEKQSQTMQGLMSTLQDEVSEFFRQMGAGAFGEVKEVLADILEQLNEWEQDGTLEEWAENLGGALADVFGTVKNIISFALDNSDTIIGIMGTIAAHKMWSVIVSGGAGIIKTFNNIGSSAATAADKIEAGGNLAAAALTIITGAIASGVTAYNEATKVSREYREELERLDQSARDAQISAETDTRMLKNKAERYEELRTAESLTAAQENELKTLAEELQSTLGNSVSVIDEQTGAYNDLSTAVDDYCEKLLKQSRLEAETDRLKELYKLREEKQDYYNKNGLYITEADQAAVKKYLSTPEDLATANFVSDAVQNFINPARGVAARITEELSGRTINDQQAQEIAQTIKAMQDLDNQIADVEETVKNYTSALYDSGDAADKAGDSAEDLSDKTAQTDSEIAQLSDTVEKNFTSLQNLASEYKNLAAAVEEYHENGQLSIDTALQMIDNGYSAAIAIDKETGAIKLNIKAYQELAKEKIKAKQTSIDLEKQQLNETNAVIMGALARASADDRERLISEYTQNAQRIKDLNTIANGFISDIDNWTSPDYKQPETSYTSQTAGTAAKVSAEIDSEKELYKSGYEAYKTEADKKLELIKRELEAKKELRDETIKAIDDEIEARKRLNEDNDLQKEIDAVKAQLKYGRLDDFSRDQLNKRLSDLYTEKSELNWQRQMSDRKDAANEKYGLYESQAAAMQEKIKQSIDTFSAIVNAVASGMSAMTVINNNNSTKTSTANINLAGQTLTMAQITKAVKDALMDDILR